jgi:CheY-like chemotaxis protein
MGDMPGRLGIHLEPFTVDVDFAGAHPSLSEGPYVRLAITDTGHGMDPATLGRVFEPFFTTKGPGRGTGLGLAVVHGIMESHDGAVTAYSQAGEGTAFHLYFPAHPSEAMLADPARPAIPRGDGTRVLLVDDEPMLAQMGVKMLERLGYAVTSATAPADAVDLFAAHPDAFDLLVTDLTMPGMLGTELAARLLRIKPGLPILLVTGYTATLTSTSIRTLGIGGMALKPLSFETLGRAVHEVITASEPA